MSSMIAPRRLAGCHDARIASGEPMISKTAIFAAGERLAQDFQFAGMMPRLTSSWSEPGTGGQRRSAPGAGIEMSDNRLAAQTKSASRHQ